MQVAEEEQNLWEEYAQLRRGQPHFAMRKVTEAVADLSVFRDLFKKEGRRAARRMTHQSKPDGAHDAPAAMPLRRCGRARPSALPDPSDWTFELIEHYHERDPRHRAALRRSTPIRTSSRSSPPSR